MATSQTTDGEITLQQSTRSISTIFVVDDEQIIASSLAAILKLQGFDAFFFVNPHDALEAAQVTSPDLLISDVMMPALSGVELAIKVRKALPDCKVLLFSGQAQTLDLLEKARSEGHDFNLLQKPIHPTTLLAYIDRITN